MSRAIARRGLVALAGAILSLAAAVGVSAAQSRSYFISAVDIAAELRSDGSMRVVEQREFSYTGTYRGAFYTLPLRDGQQVTEFSLRDSTGVVYAPGSEDDEAPGTYAIEQSDDRFQVTWFYGEPAADERRSFTLDYVVTAAGVRHADSSELYWKWVGSGWEVPTSRLEAELRLPEAAAALTPGRELLLWAHGPLTGVVEVPRRGVVRTAVSDLPPETFVELRVLMPPDVLAAAPSDGRQARAAILAQERCLAVAADAERARARGERPAADCDPRAALGRLANAGLLVLVVGAGAGWVVLFRRHGREHRLPEGLADYERDLPSQDPPALVDYLLGWGSVGDEALVATIMDLARRGSIGLDRQRRVRDGLLGDKVDDVLVLRRLGDAETPWERSLQQLLFDQAGDGRQVTDAELKQWVKDHRQEAYRWWQSWVAELRRAGRARRWIEPRWAVAVAVLLGVALVAGGIVAGGALHAGLPLVVLAVVAGAAMVVASPLMRRRSRSGRILHHRWRRFGAFLADFSLTPERSPEALPLWGRYLVYAVPLGIADTVMRNLDANLSRVQMEQVAGGWYPLAGYDGRVGGFAEGLSSLSAAIPTSQIASSPPSSSGGGGGFSGGGGGGGGGSGGGAF